MSKFDQDEHIALWMDGLLDDEGEKQFAKACREDSAFAERVAAIRALKRAADSYEEEPVPSWQRDTGFTRDYHRPTVPWWQWQGLPAVSLVVSCFAILLVILQVEVRMDNGAFTLSFSRHTTPDVERLVVEHMENVQQAHNDFMMAEIHRYWDQQAESTNQLVNYLAAQGRAERKEDFNHLLKYVHQLRREDQLFYAEQISDMKEVFQLQSNPTNSMIQAGYPIGRYPYDINQ